ncbi:hypothetical protein EV356DRAFT_120956 [Viridothelium virens]|uniref:Uncharacterized protein n=1 Tax=Viridothelium virens TaxID=1048519 RepID=A0A6A6GRL7_VIRVR|nr:hypothetical protein EV356DRAFT_120956 [Viridothelium virens]
MILSFPPLLNAMAATARKFCNLSMRIGQGTITHTSRSGCREYHAVPIINLTGDGESGNYHVKRGVISEDPVDVADLLRIHEGRSGAGEGRNLPSKALQPPNSLVSTSAIHADDGNSTPPGEHPERSSADATTGDVAITAHLSNRCDRRYSD